MRAIIKYIILTFCLIAAAPHISAESDVKIYIDSEQLMSNPIIKNDKVFIPVRSIFEHLGADVGWNGQTDSVSIKSPDSEISLRIGSDIVLVNNFEKKLDSPVRIISDKSYIPLRSAAQLFFCTTVWDEGTRTVNIYKDSFPPVSERYNYLFESEILTLVNNIRTHAGLSRLEQSNVLSFAARLHAEDMYTRNFFDHVNPDGKSPFERMREFGISYSYAAENIARGYYSPKEVVDGWMNSETHRQNILNPVFNKMGAGFCAGYWCQEFTE